MNERGKTTASDRVIELETANETSKDKFFIWRLKKSFRGEKIHFARCGIHSYKFAILQYVI